ncbi:hypothetical protein K402DRAFT_444333 [Aulographum hederae CBS 113979]|uniref:EKC/KEOPS complex subunit BUD32 n=1 Tax=Aulographum hederae CBS 113979 TaxID=1176131 RepID=A0A6G1HBB4_9PEZI|nr:hypothetical protein K402DRAFT_444333 [Aulographum hederae CBS 113979]
MADASRKNTFDEDIRRLRAAYQQKRDSTNLFPPVGNSIWDIDIDTVNGTVRYTYWFELDCGKLQCIRLLDIPGTLSGHILRLNQNLPPLDSGKDYEINGDEVVVLDNAPDPPDFEPDDEDITVELETLPIVSVDPTKHFTKKGKYRSEILNLLACQVFEKFNPRYVLGNVHTFTRYKSWILQVIDGLMALHSFGIVHRDLRIDNLVFTRDGLRTCIIDLESRWGNRLAPEVVKEPVLDAGWSERSDIFDLGHLVKGLIYGNTPVTSLVEWVVPAMLESVVEACTRESPADRPSLTELSRFRPSISRG